MRSSTFWFGLSTGAAVGVLVGTVCARMHGEVTRGRLREGVRKMRAATLRQGRRLLHARRWVASPSISEMDWGSGQADVQSAWML